LGEKQMPEPHGTLVRGVAGLVALPVCDKTTTTDFDRTECRPESAAVVTRLGFPLIVDASSRETQYQQQKEQDTGQSPYI